jgi:hypothetical protein
MAAMTPTAMATATRTMGKGYNDDNKDDNDGKNNDGCGGGIPA